MKQFIKLTSRIINRSHIIEIIKQPNKYLIYTSNNYISGHFIIGNGDIHTKQYIIEICEKRNKLDYIAITDVMNE
jgi:hypothetical protein